MLNTRPQTEWGVRHSASADRVTHVDPRASYADACHWLHALKFCGNRDATLVWRAPGEDWHEVIPAVTP